MFSINHVWTTKYSFSLKSLKGIISITCRRELQKNILHLFFVILIIYHMRWQVCYFLFWKKILMVVFMHSIFSCKFLTTKLRMNSCFNRNEISLWDFLIWIKRLIEAMILSEMKRKSLFEKDRTLSKTSDNLFVKFLMLIQ